MKLIDIFFYSINVAEFRRRIKRLSLGRYDNVNGKWFLHSVDSWQDPIWEYLMKGHYETI
jgi:hypothetical protein